MACIEEIEAYLNETYPLYRAVKSNNCRRAKQLLQEGLDVNQITKNGNSPIIIASERGHEKMCSLLLSFRADVGVTDAGGNTPLHLGVRGNHRGIVKLLLRKGADVNQTTNYGNTPLNLATLRADTKMCRLLLRFGGDPNIPNKIGQTPLSNAVRRNQWDTFKLLVENHADVTKSVTFEMSESSAIDIVFRYLDEKICEVVAKSGVDLNTLNCEGTTPLHLTVEKDRLKLAELLLECKADVNRKDDDGLSALHIAARRNNMAMCKLLLRFGAVADCADRCGVSPLHLTVEEDNLKLAELLLKSKVDVNRKDDDGRSPLLIAAKRNNTEMCRLLWTFGADAFSVNQKGNSPLYESVKESNDKLVELFLLNNPSTGRGAQYELYALKLAAAYGKKDICELLLGFDSNFNAINESDDNLLFFAVKGASFHRVLKRDNFYVNKRNDWKWKKLARTFPWPYRGEEDLVDFFLKLGVKVDCANKEGVTPLHICVARKKPTLVRPLLLYGANPSLKSGDGLTALQLACCWNRPRCKVLKMVFNSCNNLIDEHVPFEDCDEQWYQLYLEQISKLVIKLTTANLTVHESYRQLPLDSANLLYFRNSCENEIAAIKNDLIGDGPASIYDVFTCATSNLNCLRNANPKILETRHWLRKYPIYGKLIDWQFIRAEIKEATPVKTINKYQWWNNLLPVDSN